MREQTLTVSTKTVSSTTVVIVVIGDIDYGNYEDLVREAETALSDGHVCQVVDLSGVHLCDSSGLRGLLLTQRRAVAHGGWLRLATPSTAVSTVLSITGLDRTLDVYDTLDDALADT